MKTLIATALTYGAAFPVYLATPSCRSIPNHVGRLAIAYQHASVSNEFRASPWNRGLAPPPRRIEFVCLWTDSSPWMLLTASHLPSTAELWPTPTRPFTVLIWRSYERTIPLLGGEPGRSRSALAGGHGGIQPGRDMQF